MKGRFQIRKLEERIAPAIVKATSTLKIPGPTDVVTTTATNPAGNPAVGQQEVVELSNKDAKAFR